MPNLCSAIRQLGGVRLSQDTEQVIIALQHFARVLRAVIEQKNPDELFQRFIRHAYLAQQSLSQFKRRLQEQRGPSMQASEPTNYLAVGFRAILSSGPIQKLAMRFYQLLQDLVGDSQSSGTTVYFHFEHANAHDY
jgi:hypothetical protein